MVAIQGDETDHGERIANQLAAWRDELIDLSRRNRLLNATGGKSSVLRIQQPSIGEILTGLNLSEGSGGPGYWRLHYPPSADLEDADPSVLAALSSEDPLITDELEGDELLTPVESSLTLSRRLRSLERQAATEFMDRGVRNLYLGLGILRWSEAAEEWSESPLVLVPVALDRPSPREPFRVRATEDDAVMNPALRVKLENDFAIELPEVESLDQTEQLLGAVEELIADQSGWTVSSEGLFGRFSFQKEAMYRDLRTNQALILESTLVQAIAGDHHVDESLTFEAIDDTELDTVAAPEELFSILDADSTQRQCILAAREGHTFVMDGPPGTGKSQTIANMIAELLANERTVLFVSEKAAALDVVRSRLDDKHLGSYVLELHSNKATRKEVAQTLGRALYERPKPRQVLDAAQIERVRRHRNALSAFAAAQNEVRAPLGRTLHWAIGRHLQLDAAPLAPPPNIPVSDLSQDDYNDVLDLAHTLAASWGPVDRRDSFLWSDLRDPDDLRSRRSHIPAVLDRSKSALTRCREQFEGAAATLDLPGPRSRDDYLELLALAALLTHRPSMPIAWLRPGNSDSQVRNELIEEWKGRSIHLIAARELLVSRSERWRDLSPDTAHGFDDAAKQLAALDPLLEIAKRQPTDLDRAVRSLDWVVATGPALEQDAVELQDSLGLPRDANIEGLRAAVALGRLGGSPNLPERLWFDPERLAAARRSLARLRPIVENHRTVVDKLQQTFNSSIFQLDIERLYDGPSDVVPKLSWTSGRGRANRKQLKACSPNGKLSADLVSALPLVRQWHAINGDLQVEESSSAEALGETYYRSTTTDFDALDEALGVATNILSLTGSPDVATAVGGNLNVTSLTAGQIAATAERIGGTVEEWGRTLESLPTTGLTGRSPAEVVRWATRALVPLREAKSDVERITSVFSHCDTIGEVQSICDALTTVDDGEEQFTIHDAVLRSTFDQLYDGPETDWTVVDQASQWTAELTAQIGQRLTESVARRLLTEELPSDTLNEMWTSSERALDEVIDWFAGDRRATVQTELYGDFGDALHYLDDLGEATSEIDEWLEYEKARGGLTDLGFGEVVRYCVDNRVARSMIADVFERSMLTAWIDHSLSADPRCAPFAAEERDRVVEEYQQLDRLLVDDACGRVMAAANRRRPTSIAGSFAIIRRESERKIKHRPIQRLLAEAGAAALAIKPCFMMSPLTVSQFLPPDLKFDVVIFDEASQVRPCDAVGAVYRGEQLIVAGDNRQLPPTNFFDKATGDEDDVYDEDALDEFESVLDLCRGAASIQNLPLRWHYRSRHEDLITYSNRAFYDSSLVTYPSSTREASGVGVELIHVPDGVYGRGTSQDNQVEAHKVVERILFHADHHPEMTLGVVAFSDAQATRIQWELEAVRRDRPDLDQYFQYDRLNGFFVKNLESVQGDERDVIIFSIGYGRDENGKFTMNFGPLNKPGGERRLNVAITRARSRVEVVTSIRSGDFTDSKNLGVTHLRGYLDFAERGASALTTITAGGGEPESPFEEEVLATLRRWGHQVEPQVGQAGYRIDMAIRHPGHHGQWLLGIECDGAAYHSSATARDRDRLRQQVLEGLGWRLHRIWGPSWYHNRRAMEVRLMAAIDSALKGERPPSSSPVTVQTASNSVEFERVEFDDDAPPAWATPYRIAQLGQLGMAPDVKSAGAHAAMQRWVYEVVRQEGPVHPEVVLERLRPHWRAQGLRSAYRNLVDSAIESLRRRSDIGEDSEGFMSPTPEGSADVAVRFPDGDEQASRSVREVPRSEINRSISLFVEDAKEVRREELLRGIARIFEWRRLGSDITENLSACVEELLLDGTLEETSSGMLRRRS